MLPAPIDAEVPAHLQQNSSPDGEPGESRSIAPVADPAIDPAADSRYLVLSEASVLVPQSLQPDSLRPEEGMLGQMAGRSLVMQHLFSRMRSTAPHFRLAAIEGEAGTGKFLAAQTLHQLGPGADGPFAPWLAADFLQDPSAFWHQARGGLLWLSRVDELSADQQRSLRNFLERAAHERIRRGPGSGSALAPLQMLAGASRPFRQLAVTGSFRPDLASHLTAIRFPLPPLRDRRDDIPLLAALFLRRLAARNGKFLRGFGPGTLSRLAAYDWPGNVRELECAMAAAVLDCPGQWIRPVDIPRLDWTPPTAPSEPRQEFPGLDDPNLDRAILRHVARVLARANGNKLRAAKLLGISRSTLYRLLENGEVPREPDSTLR